MSQVKRNGMPPPSWWNEFVEELMTPPAFFEAERQTNSNSRRRPSTWTTYWPNRPKADSSDSLDGVRRRQASFVQSDIPESVLTAYDWHVVDVARQNNIVRVETRGKQYALKATHISGPRVDFLEKALGYAKQNGFQQFAPLVRTRLNRPYVTRNSKVYYATEWLPGNSVNFRSVPQLGQAARALAQFHESTRGFEANGYRPPREFHLAAMLEERTEDLQKLLAEVSHKKGQDDFDRLLVKLQQNLLTDAETSTRMANDAACKHFLSEDKQQAGLCHLDVIPDNLLYGPQNQVSLLDFDLSAYAPRVLDISHLLRRSLQQSNWNPETAYACFVAYNSVRPITAEEYRLAQAWLTFPYHAWRLAHTRYEVFADDTQLDALQSFSRQEGRRQGFLEAYAKQMVRNQSSP